jgi:mannose-1-phosphate guanylyltransferase
MREQDEMQNVVEANAMIYNTKSCFIKAQGDKLVVIQGLEGYLVADCNNVLLICPKENEDQFRIFTTDAKTKKGDKYV